ncbi:MAG: hypothetical protein CFE31_09890 [Rhizobiales bacterium PAR1]|nr:MAG: hypothetical protein CFE31_09890 [Rhizobiales bacterium PAR1]
MNPRQVGFDITPLLENNWTGIPIFTSRLVRQLLADTDVEPVFFAHGKPVRRDAVTEALSISTGLYLRSKLERQRLAPHFDIPTLDVALFPSVKQHFGFAPREASVIHDMSTLVTPEFHTPANIAHHRRFLQAELATNDVTFAVSQATASDIALYCDVPEEKLRVIYQYVDWPARFDSEFRNLGRSERNPRMISVLGTIEPRKNLKVLIAALDQLIAIDPEVVIVVMGKAGWRLDDALGTRIKSYVDRGNLVFTGFVSDFQKYCILRMSRFFVFPSFFEGFGIPVLEAMSVGTPVLASYSSSIPEVGGDDCLYFDPQSVEDLVEKYWALWNMPKHEFEALGEKLRQRSEVFSGESLYRPVREWIFS